MPLFLEQETVHKGIMGIWRIREDETYFKERLHLSEEENCMLESIKGSGRRVEWLAVRYLLHHLTGRNERALLKKDEFGKPFLPDSNYHISISHSHEMAAVLASPISCGIDIQFPVEKIKRLAPKFCSEVETEALKKGNSLQTMHVIWGAKECMFKAYGKKEIDYRKHLAVRDASRILKRPGAGTLQKNSLKVEYEIRAELVLDYILTYCFEIK